MIDSLVSVVKESTKKLDHCIVTFHRPSNVDSKQSLEKVVSLVESLPCKTIWPVHPRTKKSLMDFGLYEKLRKNPRVFLEEPKPYIEFVNLVSNSKFIITDSGGIQEEAVFLKTPCITYRSSTERPSTLDSRSNTLSMDLDVIKSRVHNIINGKQEEITVPNLWDGNAAKRIAEILQNYF